MDLAKLSDNISCDHIKKLETDYCKFNNMMFHNKFINNCYNTNIDTNYDNIDKLNAPIYISKKTCFNYTSIVDENLWNTYFNSKLNNIKFNQNTKRKLFSTY